ncbi:MAG TPA: CHASE3 domain-containing protein, partial [Polyangiaceae bacterium]|nr:CHASE3 domain-containing protein [Polyangiaceae bacterium]
MQINWTFGRKLALGFAIAALTLLLVGISGYRSTQHLIENDRLVSHTHEVRRKLTDLTSFLKDAETGQRGFVITGDDPFLEPYRAALTEIARTVGELRNLTADNDAQQRRLNTLQPMIDGKVLEMKKIIELRRSEGLGPAVKEVAAGQGKALMDQIRHLISQMDDDESALLKRRNAEAELSAESTKAVILWGSLLGIVLVAGAGTLISRSLASQIGAAVHHIQTSSAELQSAANQQATGAKEQASAMSE